MTIFGKSWDLHVIEVLGATLDQNVDMIAESVRLRGRARPRGHLRRRALLRRLPAPTVTTPCATLRAAREAGARDLVLCDTNGGTLTGELVRIFEDVRDTLAADRDAPTVSPRHPHAQRRRAGGGQLAGRRGSRSAARAGHHQRLRRALRQRQHGQRHGQPGAQDGAAPAARGWRRDQRPDLAVPAGRRDRQRHAARLPALRGPLGVRPQGRRARCRGGQGRAQLPARRSRSSSAIESRLVVSELGGRANTRIRAEQLGHNARRGRRRQGARQTIKELEAQGLAFEGAEASFELLIRRSSADYRPPFEIVDYTGALRAARGPRVPGRGHRQGQGRRRGPAHGGGWQWTRQRARRRAAQGARCRSSHSSSRCGSSTTRCASSTASRPRRRARASSSTPSTRSLSGRRWARIRTSSRRPRRRWRTPSSTPSGSTRARRPEQGPAPPVAPRRPRRAVAPPRPPRSAPRPEPGGRPATLGCRHVSAGSHRQMAQPTVTTPLEVAFAGEPGSFAEDAVLAA